MNPMSACGGLNTMSAYGASSRCILLGSRLLQGSTMPMPMPGVTVSYGCKTHAHCGSVSAKLHNHECWGSNMLYKFFWSNGTGSSQRSKPSSELGSQDSETFCTDPHSAAAATTAADLDSDAVPLEEEVHGSSVVSDQKSPGDRTLKLVCGSCCLPHPSKEATGGEDALFICVDEQAIGVADGVGGWALHGIDAGEYARELMANAVSAIKEEPKGFIDPARVLEKAHARTKKVGSSTACIIALTDQGIHAVNLGDSGFIVVREGSTVFQSPSQQHDFNYPYQLDASGLGDLPKDAQVLTVPVAPGDVIVAGTDGLFDNLYTNEVADIVMQAVQDKFGPQDTARKLAALARQQGMDKAWKSPFATAAQDAGFYYLGGKLDDVSVVVSYVTASTREF